MKQRWDNSYREMDWVLVTKSMTQFLLNPSMKCEKFQRNMVRRRRVAYKSIKTGKGKKVIERRRTWGWRRRRGRRGRRGRGGGGGGGGRWRRKEQREKNQSALLHCIFYWSPRRSRLPDWPIMYLLWQMHFLRLLPSFPIPYSILHPLLVRFCLNSGNKLWNNRHFINESCINTNHKFAILNNQEKKKNWFIITWIEFDMKNSILTSFP